MLKGTAREAAAEFLGTFILIVFGAGVVAQVVLSGEKNGGYLSINLAWGIAVTLAVYVAGTVSGGQLNPAVTLAAAVHRGFPWSKVPAYVAAQVAGAFSAAALVWFTYREAFDAFDGGVRQVAGPRTRTPASSRRTRSRSSASPAASSSARWSGTALLVLVIFALTDQDNLAPDSKITPVLVGALVVLLGMTFGFNAGYAINPARDFGPRLFTAVAGWGGEVFRAGNGWWWVPIVAPCVGAVLGGGVYDLLIRRHHPQDRSAKEAA